MNIKVIIPCHLASIRLKEKVLIDIHGLPMIEHVRRRVLLSKNVDEVFIATNDLSIKNLIEDFDGKVIQTKKNHQTGTSRVSEAISNIKCSHVILVQGDEPLLIPEYLDLFIDKIKESKNEIMWNAISNINNDESFDDTSIVKCILSKNENIISCFRKNPLTNKQHNLADFIYKIQGLIAFEKNFLINLISKDDTPFSKNESIEQMKAIEYGATVKGILIPEPLASVNTKDELKKVKELLINDQIQRKILHQIINESAKEG